MQGYENLRQEALAKQVGSRLGLGVFQQRGMAGWIHAYSFCQTTAVAQPVQPYEGGSLIGEGLAGELANILTGVILARKDMSV